MFDTLCPSSGCKTKTYVLGIPRQSGSSARDDFTFQIQRYKMHRRFLPRIVMNMAHRGPSLARKFQNPSRCFPMLAGRVLGNAARRLAMLPWRFLAESPAGGFGGKPSGKHPEASGSIRKHFRGPCPGSIGKHREAFWNFRAGLGPLWAMFFTSFAKVALPLVEDRTQVTKLTNSNTNVPKL